MLHYVNIPAAQISYYISKIILILFFIVGCNVLSHKIGPHKSFTVRFGQLPEDISSFIAWGRRNGFVDCGSRN